MINFRPFVCRNSEMSSVWCFLTLHLFTVDSPCRPRSMVCSFMGSLAEKRSLSWKKCLHHLPWCAVAGCLMMRPQLMSRGPWNLPFSRQRYKVCLLCVSFLPGSLQRGCFNIKRGPCSTLLFFNLTKQQCRMLQILNLHFDFYNSLKMLRHWCISIWFLKNNYFKIIV